MRRLKKSVTYAWHGLVYTFKHERNFQIHCLVAVGVLLLAVALELSPIEKSILFLVIALVLGMELTNTAFERVIDMLKPRVHPYARIVKDVMAGAVLMTAVLAIAIGILVFLPHLLSL
ncbi:MAG: diacylglycerol kinase [Candidatus Moranbacteria bacterium]|nr:diacylglycerol kinase [Candidatus Moranbacteria bacterium]